MIDYHPVGVSFPLTCFLSPLVRFSPGAKHALVGERVDEGAGKEDEQAGPAAGALELLGARGLPTRVQFGLPLTMCPIATLLFQMVRRSMARLKHVLAERAIAEPNEGLKRDMQDFINSL